MPSSRTSPAAWAGSRTVEQVVWSDVGHRGQRREVELAADHRGGPQRREGVAGQPLQPAGEHLLHRGRAGRASATSRARSPPSRASRAYSTRKNGLPSVRCRSAVACSSVGRLRATARRPPRPRRRRSPASSRRTACRRASASATSARAPVGSGCGAPGGQHQQGLVGGGLGEQPQHPQRGDVRPVQVVEDHQQRPSRAALADRPDEPLPGAELGPGLVRVPGSPPGMRRAQPFEHLLPRPERRGAVVLRAAPDQHATPRWPGATAASSAHSRDLPMPGSPVSDGVRRGARHRGVEGSDQGTELPVATDQRPGGQAGATGRGGLRRGHGRPAVRSPPVVRRDPRERRVLTQHGGLEVAELGAGLQAELVGENRRAPG